MYNYDAQATYVHFRAQANLDYQGSKIDYLKCTYLPKSKLMAKTYRRYGKLKLYF